MQTNDSTISDTLNVLSEPSSDNIQVLPEVVTEERVPTTIALAVSEPPAKRRPGRPRGSTQKKAQKNGSVSLESSPLALSNTIKCGESDWDPLALEDNLGLTFCVPSAAEILDLKLPRPFFNLQPLQRAMYYTVFSDAVKFYLVRPSILIGRVIEGAILLATDESLQKCNIVLDTKMLVSSAAPEAIMEHLWSVLMLDTQKLLVVGDTPSELMFYKYTKSTPRGFATGSL